MTGAETNPFGGYGFGVASEIASHWAPPGYRPPFAGMAGAGGATPVAAPPRRRHPPVHPSSLETEIALPRTVLDEMRATIVDLRRREDDLKADRDHWREAHSATQRLLPKPMPEDAQTAHWAKRAWRWSRGAS
jgi:hypothetical protein